MKKIAEHIYTADDGRVSIIPAIDVIWQTRTIDETVYLINKLFPFFVERDVIKFDSHQY
ncbi:TPA: hypothetical protein N2G31_004153 [Salmonella enterica]|nr:hypothetical protein [Salmonella enterica]HCL5346088.1 hypothetical protein [Salmonella enterica]